MHRKDPYNEIYYLEFFYRDKLFTFKLSNYHNEIKFAWYHLYHKERTFEFTYERSTGKVSEVLQHGQSPVPDDFLFAITEEIKSIHKG